MPLWGSTIVEDRVEELERKVHKLQLEKQSLEADLELAQAVIKNLRTQLKEKGGQDAY